jgi:lysophospholipase L1-like esterase
MPGALGRLKSDVLDEKPDIAIILIGGNDAGAKSVAPETTRDNLRRIAQQLADAKIRTLFLQYHVLPNPDSPQKAWTHLVRNNDMIAEIAKESGFAVLAMQPAMDEALQHQPLAQLVNTTDGVHLAPGGELVYARAIYQKLNQLGWLKGE